MKVTKKLRQNTRRFFLCQAYGSKGNLCEREANWVRQLPEVGPTYLCNVHNPS